MRRAGSPTGGFSLIEVVLAISIVAFAFLAIVGLLPAGLNNFSKAMDNSIGSQIVMRLMNEAQQTDYATLVSTPSTLRYFDNQGNEVPQITGSVYTAEVSVKDTTKLPSTSTPDSKSLATVTVRLARNPGENPTPFAPESKVAYRTYTSLVARK